MSITLAEARKQADRFLEEYGGALLRLHKQFPDNPDNTRRAGAFKRLRRYWGKKIIAAFDES